MKHCPVVAIGQFACGVFPQADVNLEHADVYFYNGRPVFYPTLREAVSRTKEVHGYPFMVELGLNTREYEVIHDDYDLVAFLLKI